MKIIYNKLVRDKIPEIIKQDGADPQIRILEEEKFLEALFKKLEEEVSELISARDNKKEVEKEIGDIYEIIEAIIENCGLDRGEILRLKGERREKRGGFAKRIFLESVDK